MAIDIPDDDHTTPDNILDRIHEHIQLKRSITLDRVEFEEYRHAPDETFDGFYVRFLQIAANADLWNDCHDVRLATIIISGISSTETRRKLLNGTLITMPKFPSQRSQAGYWCLSQFPSTNSFIVSLEVVALDCQRIGARTRQKITSAKHRSLLNDRCNAARDRAYAGVPSGLRVHLRFSMCLCGPILFFQEAMHVAFRLTELEGWITARECLTAATPPEPAADDDHESSA